MKYNYEKAMASIRIAEKQIKKHYNNDLFELCILFGGFNYFEERNVKGFDIYPNGNKEVVITIIQKDNEFPQVSEKGIEIYSEDGWNYQSLSLKELKHFTEIDK